MNCLKLNLTDRHTKNELLTFLSGDTKLTPLVIGKEVESARKFCTFLLPDDSCAGIITSGLGPDPEVIAIKNTPFLLVGHDTYVSKIEMPSRIVSASLRIDGAFFCFLPLPNCEDRLIVIHELGAICLNLECAIIWRFDSDVVEDYHIVADGSKLILHIMDADKAIEIETVFGRAIN